MSYNNPFMNRSLQPGTLGQHTQLPNLSNLHQQAQQTSYVQQEYVQSAPVQQGQGMYQQDQGMYQQYPTYQQTYQPVEQSLPEVNMEETMSPLLESLLNVFADAMVQLLQVHTRPTKEQIVSYLGATNLYNQSHKGGFTGTQQGSTNTAGMCAYMVSDNKAPGGKRNCKKAPTETGFCKTHNRLNTGITTASYSKPGQFGLAPAPNLNQTGMMNKAPGIPQFQSTVQHQQFAQPQLPALHTSQSPGRVNQGNIFGPGQVSNMYDMRRSPSVQQPGQINVPQPSQQTQELPVQAVPQPSFNTTESGNSSYTPLPPVSSNHFNLSALSSVIKGAGEVEPEIPPSELRTPEPNTPSEQEYNEEDLNVEDDGFDEQDFQPSVQEVQTTEEESDVSFN